MKKIFAVVLVAMMSLGAFAQHEIGGIVGGLNGLSYKYWFGDNLAIQADLAVGLTEAATGQTVMGQYQSWSFGVYDFTLNPNLLYHFNLPANFKLYLGGGVNLGMLSGIQNTDPAGIGGKFGINGALGATYDIQSVPLVLALDFRPGYGMTFSDQGVGVHYFDWKIAFAIRYKL